MLAFIALVGVVAGAAGAGGWAVHRLKGDLTWREAVVIVFGGGGPGPVKPK